MENDEPKEIKMFPPPPIYYLNFKEKEEEDSSAETNATTLEPPEPPEGNEYYAFKKTRTLKTKDQPLESYGVKKIYNVVRPSDWAPELKRLNQDFCSKMLAVLERLRERKNAGQILEDMKVVLINMNYLLNEYRPHEARERLIGYMRSQLKKNEASLENLRAAMKESAKLGFSKEK